MRVKGIEVTDAQVERILRSMQTRFRAADIVAAAEAAGVEKGEVAMRTADRLIQNQRKAKKIQIVDSGPYWEPA